MKTPSVRAIFVHSSFLFLLNVFVSALCLVGFYSSSMGCDIRMVAIAWLMVLAALIPPLWFEFLIGPSVAGPLAVVLWRLGVLIPAIMFTTHQIDPARKCCQVTILACYLVSLPLESWLLIRQTRQ